MTGTALVVLMRFPRLGEGKSRLAAQIGAEAAHRLHCAVVADTLGWRRGLCTVVAVSPDDAAVAAMRVALPDCVVFAQAPGDLGCRIAAAFQLALAGGTPRAVLVGTDSPSLPRSLLAQCVDSVAPGRVGMIPAVDGGFVALAMHRDDAGRDGLRWLRDGIDWSTERTAAQTVAMAARSGLEVAAVSPWYDVDEACDVQRLHADLIASPQCAPRTLRCLDALSLGTVERAS